MRVDAGVRHGETELVRESKLAHMCQTERGEKKMREAELVRAIKLEHVGVRHTERELM